MCLYIYYLVCDIWENYSVIFSSIYSKFYSQFEYYFYSDFWLLFVYCSVFIRFLFLFRFATFFFLYRFTRGSRSILKNETQNIDYSTVIFASFCFCFAFDYGFCFFIYFLVKGDCVFSKMCFRYQFLVGSDFLWTFSS